MDLIKNFSDVRMTHMREVAKVLLADKVQRILAERNADAASVAKGSASDQTKKIPVEAKRISVETKSIVGEDDRDIAKSGQLDSVVIREPVQSRKEEQDRMILEAKKKLEQENREMEQKRLADDRRVEQQRQLYQNQEDLRGDFSKKAIGIAIAAVAVIVIVLILLLK